MIFSRILDLKINPITAQRDPHDQFRQNFDFILRRDHQIISYERRNYESVDDKSLS